MADRSGSAYRDEKLEIEIDREACQGTGECVLRAGRTFAIGDDGRARLLDPPGDDRQTIIAAARCCPHFAIAVRAGGMRMA